MPSNSFGSRATLTVDGQRFTIFRLDTLRQLRGSTADRLPFSLKILLENLLRNEDDAFVKRADIEAMATWNVKGQVEKEIAFRTSRVLLQDFTGVPAVVDLAAMRDAIVKLGGDAQRINPLQPVDLVIDHSVQVDEYGTDAAYLVNTGLEVDRNKERYVFLRWGQDAFRNFRVVPPGTGICHQVNLEYLAKTVFTSKENGETVAYPDSLVGTDSHTTMVNGLGVLGWGVGGIEAEAAMLGQPVSMLIPEVVGFKLHGRLPAGATATDLVLTATQMLRQKKVVGKFVEFYGTGLTGLPLADRATIANMAPEYGATMGFFPVDEETLKYLRMTGRPESHVKLVEAYTKEQGLFRTDSTADPLFTDTLELDLGTVEPSLAGPKRPQDRVPLRSAKQMYRDALQADLAKIGGPAAGADAKRASQEGASHSTTSTAVLDEPAAEQAGVKVQYKGETFTLRHGAVVIAAITSCTNTSNPAVMLAAGMLARNAVNRGLTVKPWVKTSTAPGSRVVSEYYNASGLQQYLDKLGFQIVGYGCTTCIGNSGPLPDPIAKAIEDNKLVTCAVLSGNRNFEGRVNPLTRFNYLASPPLVVAYALAGRMDIDLTKEPLGIGKDGPVFLRDIWPTPNEVHDEIIRSVKSEFFKTQYADVFRGDDFWQKLDVPHGETFAWDENSTYVKNPPYF
ncbi:MAG TPA: aconitate hydratase AcnA, partial [Gemmatimonadaceae bacterium]|nr:aconitate hydratase AcnA [Gemmatimonadaceae bacterium]